MVLLMGFTSRILIISFQQRINLCSADEIVFRESTDGMCAEINLTNVVTDFHVGVVVLLMSDPRHGIHESHGLVIIFKTKSLTDDFGIVTERPTRKLLQHVCGFISAKRFNTAFAGFAGFFSESRHDGL